MALTVAVLPHALTVEGLSAREAPPGATARGVGLEEGWSGWLNGVAVADPDAPLPDSGVLVLRRGVAGDGDSDPLRLVLQFALLAATLAIPGAGWAAGLSGWQVGAIQAAAVIGGSVVINAIAPVTPAVDDDPAVPERAWTLSAGGNRARPNGPLPLVLGAHRMFPDLAARPYATFDGRVPLRDALIVNSARARPAGLTNARWSELRDLPEFQAPRESAAGGSVDQFLHQIFNFGLGDLDVSELKVGETALADLDEATTQWSDAQGAITLVRGNVDTAAGDALDTDWTQRAAPAGTVEIGLDFAASLFRLAGGGVAEQSVAVKIEIWNDKTPAEKRAWDVTFKHAETTPFRVTLRAALDGAGAYQVRVKRAAAASSDDAVSDDVAWTALRSYQEDGADYGGQTRLAVRLRATAQVNGRLDRLSGLVKQKIPVWETPEGATEPAWSAPKPSSNPAWLFRWYALGIRRGAKLLAGAGLPPARVDDTLLKRWGGGEIWVAYDGGESRLAARIGPGETDAAWLAPTSGSATIRAIPGSAAAPAGAIRSLEWTIGGSLGAPAAPANFAVVAVSGGYLAEWDPSDAPDYAATEVLDAPYQTSAALPRTAQRRQLADATAYSRVGAGEARLRVWARHVNHAGQQGATATADVTPDPSGGMTWRGDWTTGTRYAVDDAVSHDGRSWICTTAHAAGRTGPTTDSHANWNLLANKGDDGVEGEGIDWRGAWASGTRYAVDDAVSHDGRSWICTRAHTARRTGPTTDSHANWDLLADRGSKGVTWKGAWASGTAYAVDDAVGNDGRSWICTRAHTAGRTGPTEDSHANWGLLAERGDDGVDGEGIDWRGAWASGTSYAVDDAVSNDGRSWICTTAHAAGRTGPTTDSHANWDLLADKGVKGDTGAAAVTVDYTAVDLVIPWVDADESWFGGLLFNERVTWQRGTTVVDAIDVRLDSRVSRGAAQCRLTVSFVDTTKEVYLTEVQAPGGGALSSSRRRRTRLTRSQTVGSYAAAPRNWLLEVAGLALPIAVRAGVRPPAAVEVTTVSTPSYGFFLRGSYTRSATVRVTWTKGTARRVIDVTARARSSAANVEIFNEAVAGGTLGRVQESAYAWQSSSSAQRTYTVDGVDAVITAVDWPEGP